MCRIVYAHFWSPGPCVFQTLYVRYSYLFILLVILLYQGSQIEIFGEAPPSLKSELKIIYVWCKNSKMVQYLKNWRILDVQIKTVNNEK
jgi:hypothetical protein